MRLAIPSLAVAAAAAIAASAAIVSFAAPSPGEVPVVQAQAAPDFQGIEKWLNSPPLDMAALRGKVVLVDFWTYTCVNCLNQLPHVKEWDAKYRDKGLVTVGVHTPEFAFERSTSNVQKAIDRLQIRYPVAQDNSYTTWRAYRNQYWPAIYLIDKQGRIVYSHFGEGAYAETERKIQALLAAPPTAPSTGS